MDRPFARSVGKRRRRRQTAPVWVFQILAAVVSAVAAYGWTRLPPPDVFVALVRMGGPTWATPYVAVEGAVIGVAVWAVIYFAFLMDRASFIAGLVLLAAAVLPALAVSDIARFHALEVARDQQLARQAAVRYHNARDRVADRLNANMNRLALFDISYRAWTVHPADFPRFEANLVTARALLAVYRGRAGDARRELQADIRRLPMSKAQQNRLLAVAERDMSRADCEAFWTLQNQELDETAALLKLLEQADGGEVDEAEFGRHQAALYARLQAANQHYDRLYKAEMAREQALVDAVR
jgi:hypothetical protein